MNKMEKLTGKALAADLRALFSSALDVTAFIPLMISGGKSNIVARCNGSTLTDFRVQYAERVLGNILAYKNQSSEVVISSNSSDGKSFNTYVIGPVINPATGKKDSTTTFEEYAGLRQCHVKTRQFTQGDQTLSEAWIIEAVVCYDFLHKDITKPIQAMGLSKAIEVDPAFREAIKVLYNRSRVACIIQKFEAGVSSSLYPPLPSLEVVNLKLLKHKSELEISKKYIAGFAPMLEKFVLTRIAKITSELWRFLLFLSQDYSQYYSQVRTLCDEHNRSFPTMHARIWMLKVILSIYDAAFAFLNLKPLDYV